MTKVYFFITPDEITEYQMFLRRVLDDGTALLFPDPALNGNIRLDHSSDMFVISDLAISQLPSEIIWREIIKTNKPIIILNTGLAALPAPLRLYNTIDFHHKQQGMRLLAEQIEWLSDPALDRFYKTIHISVHESGTRTVLEKFRDDQTEDDSRLPLTVMRPPQPRRWRVRGYIAAAVAMIAIVVAIFIVLLNPDSDEPYVILITQPPSSTPKPTETPTPTIESSPEGCCITVTVTLAVQDMTATTAPVTSNPINLSTATRDVIPILEVTNPGVITEQVPIYIPPVVTTGVPIQIPTQNLPTATQNTVSSNTPMVTPTAIPATITPTTTFTLTPSPTNPVPHGSPELDTDKDGIIDSDETDVFKTDMNNPDTDADGIPDGVEVYIYFTNPLKPDSDEDGLTDAEEIRNGETDPNIPDNN